LERSYNTNSQV